MSSYLGWKVGDRVACTTDLSNHRKLAWFDADIPIKGRIYTIREIFTEDRLVNDGSVWVRLTEIVNAPCLTVIGPYEPAFGAKHFRKVQPRKTSIASLEAILHGARVPEDA